MMISPISTSTAARPWCVIVNPNAGGGRCGKEARVAVSALRDKGHKLDVLETSAPLDATEIARIAYQRGVRSFLCVGGDGTTHEVVNGVLPLSLQTGEKATIAMLPLGTGNSFLRDFQVFDAKTASARFDRGEKHDVDALRITHASGELYAFNLVGLGFAARAGALTNQRYKGFGVLGYVLAVVQSTIDLKADAVPFTTDRAARDARPALLLSFSNSRCTGGQMQMAPHASASDGELDVIRIGAMPRHRFLTAFPSIFQGTHVERPEVEETRAKHVEFEMSQPADAMIDGEILSLQLKRIEVVHHAFRVVA